MLLNGEELTVDSTSFAYFDEKNKYLIFNSDYKCYIKDLNNMNNECIYLRSGSWQDFAIKDEIIVFKGGDEVSSNITVYNTKKKTKEDILDKNKCNV